MKRTGLSGSSKEVGGASQLPQKQWGGGRGLSAAAEAEARWAGPTAHRAPFLEKFTPD